MSAGALPGAPPEAAARLAGLGLSVIHLCGPSCDHERHGEAGHPAAMSGKLPLRGGWQRAGYRPAAALLREHRPGCNLGVLCGLQEGAPVSVACVDGDGPEALAWMRANLPPTPVRDLTRRGEHWYYLATAPVRNRNLRHCTPWLELEVLGNGRQVVVPPSVHQSGHAYTEAEPWTPALLAAMPAFDPGWFAGFSTGAPPVAGAPAAPGPATAWRGAGGSWPGDREFSRGELSSAFERALAYLSSPRCPESVSGQGGHDRLYQAAVKVLRGFPLASPARVSAMARGESVAVDAEDAMHEAFRLLSEVYNPRCKGEDGESPYPWTPAELWHKVESAARAERLPGPDYWLYDADPRAAHAPPYLATAGLAGAGDGSTRGDWGDAGEPGEEDADRDVGEAGGEGGDGDDEGGDAAGGGAGDAGPPGDPTLGGAVGQGGGGGAPARPAGPCGPFSALEPVNGDAPPPGDGLVRIEIDHDTERMKDQAIGVLATMDGVYVRGSVLCDLVRETGRDRWGQPRRPWVRKTSKAFLKSRMNSAAHWFSVKAPRGARDEGEAVEVRERSDAETVSAVLAAGVWPGVPRLEGIVYVPVLRKDGTILQEPGFDRSTGLYYHQELEHGEIEAPTASNVERAKEYLFRVVADFPFEDPRVARAVWLSAVLTRFCRYSYHGLAPMFAVSARESSSGKSLLAECAAIISDGRPVDMLPFTGDEQEAKREILALLSRDDTHSICLDNIKITLSSAAYEAMLTGSATVGREVGTSEVKRIVMSDAVWWATGNDLTVGPDMSRRCLLMKIYDRSGSPTQRRVQIEDLKGYCRDKRAGLVRACLVILAGFRAAGAPQAEVDCDGVPVGDLASYGAWSDVVRQCVVWAGLPDPARALASKDADVSADKTASNGLVMHWLRAFGPEPVQASAAVAALVKNPGKYAGLVNYLADHGVDKINTRSVGGFVKAHMAGIWTDDAGKKHLLCFSKRSEGNFYLVREEE